MQIKKAWTCNNQCGIQCCSEVFLKLTESNRHMWEKHKYLIFEKKELDMRYVSFHRNMDFETLDKLIKVRVLPKGKPNLIWNDIEECWYLYIDDVCDKLLPNNRCRVYRNRPQICKMNKCPVFETDPKIAWFGKNGKLKEKRQEAEEGKITAGFI